MEIKKERNKQKTTFFIRPFVYLGFSLLILLLPIINGWLVIYMLGQDHLLFGRMIKWSFYAIGFCYIIPFVAYPLLYALLYRPDKKNFLRQCYFLFAGLACFLCAFFSEFSWFGSAGIRSFLAIFFLLLGGFFTIFSSYCYQEYSALRHGFYSILAAPVLPAIAYSCGQANLALFPSGGPYYDMSIFLHLLSSTIAFPLAAYLGFANGYFRPRGENSSGYWQISAAFCAVSIIFFLIMTTIFFSPVNFIDGGNDPAAFAGDHTLVIAADLSRIESLDKGKIDGQLHRKFRNIANFHAKKAKVITKGEHWQIHNEGIDFEVKNAGSQLEVYQDIMVDNHPWEVVKSGDSFYFVYKAWSKTISKGNMKYAIPGLDIVRRINYREEKWQPGAMCRIAKTHTDSKYKLIAADGDVLIYLDRYYTLFFFRFVADELVHYQSKFELKRTKLRWDWNNGQHRVRAIKKSAIPKFFQNNEILAVEAGEQAYFMVIGNWYKYGCRYRIIAIDKESLQPIPLLIDWSDGYSQTIPQLQVQGDQLSILTENAIDIYRIVCNDGSLELYGNEKEIEKIPLWYLHKLHHYEMKTKLYKTLQVNRMALCSLTPGFAFRDSSAYITVLLRGRKFVGYYKVENNQLVYVGDLSNAFAWYSAVFPKVFLHDNKIILPSKANGFLEIKK